MPQPVKRPSAELHSHLGAAVHPSILWSIAHRQGIKLPTKSYWEFEDMITMSGKERNRDLDEMHANFYRWTELIQSSPEAIEESVKATIGGGYRRSNIVLHELRFNPMFRNRSGERDLDHIILAALWGAEKAMLEYPQVKAGVILMMDRMLSFSQNAVIAKKAAKYRSAGVVGLDVAGPERKSFSMRRHADLFKQARAAGLGITVHTGEAGSLDELRYVIRSVKPDRVGHGILCAKDERLMSEISSSGIVLEICPTSNLRNSAVRGAAELRNILRTLLRRRVRFAICTDGPEMYQTDVHQEEKFLLEKAIMTQEELDQCSKWAFSASFLK